MSRELIDIFSENLQRIMKERDKTQADLARYFKVSSATASDWYNGKKMPRADKLQSLANWLTVDLSDLLKENSEISISAKLTNYEEQLLQKFRSLPVEKQHSIMPVCLILDTKKDPRRSESLWG